MLFFQGFILLFLHLQIDGKSSKELWNALLIDNLKEKEAQPYRTFMTFMTSLPCQTEQQKYDLRPSSRICMQPIFSISTVRKHKP